MKQTAIVAILNLTPDSFSDGGEVVSLEDCRARIQNLIQDGADVIDIGAESTRPGAVPVDHEEEWRRLSPFMPYIIEDCKNHGVLVSIDTRNPQTAKKCIDLGVNWINDVSAGQNPAMLELIAESGVDYVIMHSLDVPVRSDHTLKGDVTLEVLQFAERKVAEMESMGIHKSRMIFDPGIGFGKDAEGSFRLVNDAALFVNLGVRVMYGHSRKSMYRLLDADSSPKSRDNLTIKTSLELRSKGVDFVRVHDVAGHKRVFVNSI